MPGPRLAREVFPNDSTAGNDEIAVITGSFIDSSGVREHAYK